MDQAAVRVRIGELQEELVALISSLKHEDGLEDSPRDACARGVCRRILERVGVEDVGGCLLCGG